MKISIILYARNREQDIELTFNSIQEAINENPQFEYEIIFVNDQSTDETLVKMQQFASVVITTKGQHGINNAIFSGLDESRGDIFFPIPGHDMFKKDAISKVISNCSNKKITIGFRSNLRQARPIVKFISSRLLLLIYRIITGNEVKDIHGLVAYPTKLLRDTDRTKIGHGFHMIPITLALSQGYELNQISIKMNELHTKRSGMKKRDYFPAFSAILDVIGQIKYANKLAE